MGISSEHRVHSEREPRGEKLLWKTFVNLPLSSGNPSGPIPLSCMMRVKPCFELGWSRQEWSLMRSGAFFCFTGIQFNKDGVNYGKAIRTKCHRHG